MDREFFQGLKEAVETFKEKEENDKQLQMAIDYLLHELKE